MQIGCISKDYVCRMEKSLKYRNYLLESLNVLYNTLKYLEHNIVNLVMAGEFSEVDSMFQPGETVRFWIEDFQDVEDKNVQVLFSLFQKLEEKYESIRNINAISDEEITNFLNDKEQNDRMPF